VKIKALGYSEITHVLRIEIHRLQPGWILTGRHMRVFHLPRYENEITNTIHVDERASMIVNGSIAEEALFQGHDSVSDVSKHFVL